MKHFKLKYSNGNIEIKTANSTLELIKKYGLATREHINTRIIELEGEQLAIAISNY